MEKWEQQVAELQAVQQQLPRKSTVHQRIHHRHPQVTHRDLDRNRRNTKAVRSEEGNQVMRVKAGIYTHREM